jgi:hypothetical protein
VRVTGLCETERCDWMDVTQAGLKVCVTKKYWCVIGCVFSGFVFVTREDSVQSVVGNETRQRAGDQHGGMGTQNNGMMITTMMMMRRKHKKERQRDKYHHAPSFNPIEKSNSNSITTTQSQNITSHHPNSP